MWTFDDDGCMAGSESDIQLLLLLLLLFVLRAIGYGERQDRREGRHGDHFFPTYLFVS